VASTIFSRGLVISLLYKYTNIYIYIYIYIYYKDLYYYFSDGEIGELFECS